MNSASIFSANTTELPKYLIYDKPTNDSKYEICILKSVSEIWPIIVVILFSQSCDKLSVFIAALSLNNTIIKRKFCVQRPDHITSQ